MPSSTPTTLSLLLSSLPPSSLQTIKRLALCLSLAALFLTAACANSVQPEKSEPPLATSSNTPQVSYASPSPSPSEQPTPFATPAAATASNGEVQSAVTRVYSDTVIVNTAQDGSNLSYLTGDFNGDGSPDLAVMVKPSQGKTVELNSELANWVLEDPRSVVLPGPVQDGAPPKPSAGPEQVQPEETLLAIIHGHGARGWRNADARQTYLLTHAVGSQMSATPFKSLLKADNAWSKTFMRNQDVIKETLAGQNGFIYWTGAKYAWHAMK